MTKPVERSGYVEVWICIKQMPDGKFFLDSSHSSEFGMGYFKTEAEALHHQTICMLKNERVNVFKLEWPL
jgi:hypothetical protein